MHEIRNTKYIKTKFSKKDMRKNITKFHQTINDGQP